MFYLLPTLALLVSFALGDTAEAQTAGPGALGKREQALALIETARAQASKGPEAEQAAILFSTNRGLMKIEPAQAQRDLDLAFEIVGRLGEPQAAGFSALAAEIVGQTAKTHPALVEANLPSEPELKEMALATLVQYRLAKKDVEKAIELQRQMASGYISARQILQALPVTQNQERARVFASVLVSYRQSRHSYTIGHPEDFASLIVRFWRDLPAGLVREAIDEVLKRASDKEEPNNAQIISASSPAGTISFASAYEFRVFQMLPILKVLDRPRADALEQTMNNMRSLLQKYPQGQQSLDPTMRSTPLQEDESSQVTYAISSTAGQAPGAAATLETSRMVRQMEHDLKDDPKAAIAAAAAVADANERGAMLVRIARSLANTEPDLAKLALQKLRDSGTLNPVRSLRHLLDGAETLVSLGDAAEARRLLDLAGEQVRTLYAQDADPDNPNQALKLFWPSTHGWRDMIAVAAKISDQDALGIIQEIPDEQIQSLERVMLAGVWLDVPVWRSTSPMVSRRNR